MTLATCAKDVRFYKWPSITLVGTYETPEDNLGIKSLSWCCEGKNVVVVKSKGSPVIVKAPEDSFETEQIINSVQQIQQPNNVVVAAFSALHPNIIAFGDTDGNAHLFDLNKNKEVFHYKQLPNSVQFLDFGYSDLNLVAGCNNGQIFLYNDEGKPNASLVVPSSYSLSALLCHKWRPNLLSGASKEGVVSVWDASTTDTLLIARNHSNMVTDLAFLDDCISSVGIDGKLVSYDLRSNDYACYNLKVSLAGLAFQPGKHEIAISTCNGQLRAYDTRYMTAPLFTLVLPYSHRIKKIAFAQNIPPEDDSKSSLAYEKTFPITSVFKRQFFNSSSEALHQQGSASGDFRPFGNSVTTSPPESDKTQDIGTSVSENVRIYEPDVSDVKKFLEEKIRMQIGKFEEKLLQNFYSMRIDVSKRFISLEETVAKSWEFFMDYLKNSNAGSEEYDARSMANASVKSLGSGSGPT